MSVRADARPSLMRGGAHPALVDSNIASTSCFASTRKREKPLQLSHIRTLLRVITKMLRGRSERVADQSEQNASRSPQENRWRVAWVGPLGG